MRTKDNKFYGRCPGCQANLIQRCLVDGAERIWEIWLACIKCGYDNRRERSDA